MSIIDFHSSITDETIPALEKHLNHEIMSIKQKLLKYLYPNKSVSVSAKVKKMATYDTRIAWNVKSAGQFDSKQDKLNKFRSELLQYIMTHTGYNLDPIHKKFRKYIEMAQEFEAMKYYKQYRETIETTLSSKSSEMPMSIKSSEMPMSIKSSDDIYDLD